MLRRHHIQLSRTIAFSLFAMALVLTPRAWVEPNASPDMVPVEVLDQPARCLWCESAPTPCEDPRQPAWLNPDHAAPSNCGEETAAKTANGKRS